MKKILPLFLLATLIFIGCQVNLALAAHHWVFSNDSVHVYVDDNSIDWSNGGDEVAVRTYVVSREYGDRRVENLNFYKRSGTWFVTVNGRSESRVNYNDSSGYVLNFVRQFS